MKALLDVDSCTSAWIANNVEGSYKRGVTLGMVMSLCVRKLDQTVSGC
jgi:hypothetical protein